MPAPAANPAPDNSLRNEGAGARTLDLRIKESVALPTELRLQASFHDRRKVDRGQPCRKVDDTRSDTRTARKVPKMPAAKPKKPRKTLPAVRAPERAMVQKNQGAALLLRAVGGPRGGGGELSARRDRPASRPDPAAGPGRVSPSPTCATPSSPPRRPSWTPANWRSSRSGTTSPARRS